MRLIGIQALLTLLPHRTAAIGSASGLGGGIFVAQTSATATASGIGGFNIVTAVLNSATASAAGHGSSSVIGLGLSTSGAGSAAGTGSASAVGSVVTTWNASDKAANITLSNGNLTAAGTNTSDGAVRATRSHNSGLYYFECTFGATIAGGDSGVGIANSSAVLASFGVAAANGICVFKSGQIWHNGSNSGRNIGTIAGNVICVALDMTHARSWIRNNNGPWNNDGTANPATNVGGTDISAWATANTTQVFPIFAANGNGDTGTANFGASTFAFTVPSGFSSWAS